MEENCCSRSGAGYSNSRRIFMHRIARRCILLTSCRSFWGNGVTAWTTKLGLGPSITKCRGRSIASLRSTKPWRIVKKTARARDDPSLRCKEGLKEVFLTTHRLVALSPIKTGIPSEKVKAVTGFFQSFPSFDPILQEILINKQCCVRTPLVSTNDSGCLGPADET